MSDQFLEIVFSFDTTGSMSPCLQFLRKKLQASIGRLFRDVPNLRIGIVAHGDYEDARYTYVTKQYPLTTAYSKLEEFVQSVKSTNGYDFDECYEFVLHEVQKYNWLPGSKRILVMLGDAHPHMPSYCHNTLNLDWKAETKKLVDMGVSVYAIKCLDHNTKNFWEALAKVGKGKFIELEELSDISDLVMGIVLSQTGQLEEYVKELETAGTMTRSVSKLYSSLREVDVSKFKIMTVSSEGDRTIDEFVRAHGIMYKTGNGYYELTKPETVQDHKGVILHDKATNKFWTGAEARTMLGLPTSGDARLNPKKLPREVLSTYDIFIQSTSVNRKLKAGTKFLYETHIRAGV